MTKTPRFRRRMAGEGNDKHEVVTPRPAAIQTPAERGQALRHWLETSQVSVTAFAKAAGVSRNTLTQYLNGTVDLAYVDQKITTGIIEALGVSDWDAWEILGIPEDAQSSFKTFRPYPLGHGPTMAKLREIVLSEPLVGELSLPAQTRIMLDPAATEKRIHVIQLEDGRYFSVSVPMLSRAGGTYIGALLSAHF